ncbi:tail tubular protein [Vibrio phage VPMS1]|uniref:tail tubular protein n=1 Tax=Vibrio phage VPMS1 TaxID=1233488 RepID=UPI00035845A9|nr:tail tubular protein [Vibrio phage VPMS1]AFV51104.1 tail tubular protein [Vibrio phage VPMS1]
MEDLAQGEGKVNQQRGGKQYNLGKVDLPYAVLTEAALKALDVTKVTKAKLNKIVYKYDIADNSGITPNVGLGSWIKSTDLADTSVEMYTGNNLEDWARDVDQALVNGGHWVDAGEWSTDPVVTESNQYISYAGTNQRFRPLSLPYHVNSSAHPDPNALLPNPSTGYEGELVDISQFATVLDITAAVDELRDSISYFKCTNESNLALGVTVKGETVPLEEGQVWTVISRGQCEFLLEASGSGDGIVSIPVGSLFANLVEQDYTSVKNLGGEDTLSYNLSQLLKSISTSSINTKLKLGSNHGYSGNMFLSDGQAVEGKGSGNLISSNKGTRLRPTDENAKIRLFPHSKLSDIFIDGKYDGTNKAVDGIYLKPHLSGDSDYVAGDPTAASIIWTKLSNINIQNFANNISIEGNAYNLWFENIVSVAGRLKQVGGGESTFMASNFSDTTGQEVVYNENGKMSFHGGAIQNTNGGYPCVVNKGKILMQGVYMENARAGSNQNAYLVDNYGTVTIMQPKSMAMAEKGIRGRAGSRTYLHDCEFTGNNASTNEVFNGRGDDNNVGGGYLYFENLLLNQGENSGDLNYIEWTIGGYSSEGYSIECGSEKILYENRGDSTTGLSISGGTLAANNTDRYLDEQSLLLTGASTTPTLTVSKTLRGLAGHLVLLRVAINGQVGTTDNLHPLINWGASDVVAKYTNVELDISTSDGNVDKWYYLTTCAVLKPGVSEHNIAATLLTSLGGSGTSDDKLYIDKVQIVDCGLVYKTFDQN